MQRRRRKGTNKGLSSLVKSQTALCNIPILVLVLIASLDNADKQMMASSFPLLEHTLNLTVDTLGYFSMISNLSYSLSLPFWGYLVHTYGMAQTHQILAIACTSWGLATSGIAMSGSFLVGQAIFRAMNGAALGSILPLSQTLMTGMVQPAMRGQAFGWMVLCEKLAGTTAAASVVYFNDWQRPYCILGAGSILVGILTWSELTPRKRLLARLQADRNALHADNDTEEDDTTEKKMSIWEILRRISRIPAFVCLVAQGVFGGTPWDMMSFTLLLLEWRQFSKEQIVTIQFTSGISGMVGSWMGGFLGDIAARYSASAKGRIAVAVISVLGGIPLYGLFLFATNFKRGLVCINLFHLIASWPTAGALRPICADLARNPSERAQIVSLWIVLEKTSGAIFGAPLVGYMTNRMMKNASEHGEMENKAHLLALNLFGLSTLFWVICAVFWILMADAVDSHRPHRKRFELAMHRKESN